MLLPIGPPRYTAWCNDCIAMSCYSLYNATHDNVKLNEVVRTNVVLTEPEIIIVSRVCWVAQYKAKK